MSNAEKNPGENSLEKTKIKQLPHVTSNKSSVKFHQSDDFSPEELAILRPEYEQYLQPYKNQWYCLPLSFSDWWRTMADNAKENAKYE